MPGVYAPGEYDLAGFCVGAVERENLLPRLGAIAEGDLLIGVASSGVHSNGFSLIRKVLEKANLGYNCAAPFGKQGASVGRSQVNRFVLTANHQLGETVGPKPHSIRLSLCSGDVLLTPTKIYSRLLLPILRSGAIKAYAHITGGGLLENIPRVVPQQLAVDLGEIQRRHFHLHQRITMLRGWGLLLVSTSR